MRKIAIAAALLGSSMALPAAAQTVVNIDGSTNASLDGSNAVYATFGPGTYRFTFTNGAFTAFSRFSGSSGCNSFGASCTTGFENSARLLINGATILFGDGAASGGLGPKGTGGYYDTAAQSLAAAGKYVGTFTLASQSEVGFYLYDDYLGDNRAGVSLAIAAVPEPASWGLMILGFGVVGAAMRRRKDPLRTTVRFA